jgi:hypothetical protein
LKKKGGGGEGGGLSYLKNVTKEGHSLAYIIN